MMDTLGGSHSDTHHPMEPLVGSRMSEGGNTGYLGLRGLETSGQLRPVTPSPSSLAAYGGTTPITPTQKMDNQIGLPALPGKLAGCLYIALPDHFDRKKENYRRFRWQFSLFLTANRSDFKEKESMIWFTLSYMKGGDAELWANAYVDKALENNDWGTWEEFLDRLAKDFSNIEEPRKALEELGKLQQGKRMVAKYFLRFEQLAHLAGIDLNHYLNTTLYVERNVQHVLIDQLYRSNNLPTNYLDYKRRIMAMDEMRRWWGIHKTPQWMTTTPQVHDTNAMEVDRTARREVRKCFVCAKEGHLARVCPEWEKKTDF
jgi:hypothetical protein